MVEPLVTVVVPTLNRRDYVAASVQSVLNQTYKNIEVIISDNGGAESIKDFLTLLIPIDYRIVFRKNKVTLPVIEHLNECLNLANGKYFLIVSDDDTISPNFVELFVKRFEENPKLSIGISSNVIINEKSEIVQNYPFGKNEDWEIKNGIQFIRECMYEKRGYPVLTLISLFTVTDLFKRIGGFPFFEKGGYSDTAAAINLLFEGDIVFEKEAIFYYRVYMQSSGLSMPYTSLGLCSNQFINYFEKRKLYFPDSKYFNHKMLKLMVRDIAFDCYFHRINSIYKLKGFKRGISILRYGLTGYEAKILLNKIFYSYYKRVRYRLLSFRR